MLSFSLWRKSRAIGGGVFWGNSGILYNRVFVFFEKNTFPLMWCSLVFGVFSMLSLFISGIVQNTT